MAREYGSAVADETLSRRTKEHSSSEAAFVDWAKVSLVPLSSVSPQPPWDDLAPLGEMIGDANVVALGEGVHGAAEPLEFRNRLLQYLVMQKGFTAVAIESGMVEGRVVHDYVRGGPGELNGVMTQGLSWTFDRLPQNWAMIEWLRAHNAAARDTRKINFYGFDVPGSPANGSANRGVETAIEEALRYLKVVDGAAAGEFEKRLEPILSRMRFSLYARSIAPGYEGLSRVERDALTALTTDVICLFERRESIYTAASSAAEYDWAMRSAMGARQVDSWLRQIPLGWQRMSEPISYPNDRVAFLATAADVRDRAQADNLDWIIDREGPRGKVLVFAHRYHLSAVPVKGIHDEPRKHANDCRREVAGTYLRRRLGQRLVTIGNFIQSGAVGCGDYRETLRPASKESIDRLARTLRAPLFLLDVRHAPARALEWLDQERRLAHEPQGFKLAVGNAFDVLLCMDKVTPATA